MGERSHGAAHGNWVRKRYEKRETRYAVIDDPQMLQKTL